MKVLLFQLLLFVILVSVQCTQETNEAKRNRIRQPCKTSTGVSEENFLKLHNGERVEDTKIQEYALCILKQVGYMNEQGHLQIDVIKTGLAAEYGSEEKAENVVKKCIAEKVTPLVTAYESSLCAYRLSKNYKK